MLAIALHLHYLIFPMGQSTVISELQSVALRHSLRTRCISAGQVGWRCAYVSNPQREGAAATLRERP